MSMDGRGRALDNIFIERLWRSLKYEYIYLKAYDSVPELIEGVAAAPSLRLRDPQRCLPPGGLSAGAPHGLGRPPGCKSGRRGFSPSAGAQYGSKIHLETLACTSPIPVQLTGYTSMGATADPKSDVTPAPQRG